MRVVLAGARGVAGRVHERIYQSMGISVVAMDIADSQPATLDGIRWDEAILDVCTPTSVHTRPGWPHPTGCRPR